MKQRIIASAIFALFAFFAVVPAKAQQAVTVASCGSEGLSPAIPYALTQDQTGKLCVNAAVTVSASIAPFTPSTSGARGTPIAVTTSDSSGTLPTNTGAVLVSNPGANLMYCNVNGVAATISDQPITSGGGWFNFGIPTGITALHCIAPGGSTTANMVGGSGLATGTGGGGGGGGGAVTLASGAVASGAFSAGSYAAGAVVAGAFVDGWDLTQGTKADSAWTSGSGSVIALLKAIAGGVVGAIPTGANTIGAVTGPSAVPLATSANQTTGTQYGNQANWLSGAASQTGTTATTIITAPASNKLYVKSAQCSRDDAGTTAIRVTFNDGASTPMLLPNNGGGGANNATFDPPLIVAATTAFQFTPSTSTSTVRCSAQAYNAP